MLAALVTLNRPEKHNALDLAILRRLQAVMAELGEDAATRAVVRRGADKYHAASAQDIAAEVGMLTNPGAR